MSSTTAVTSSLHSTTQHLSILNLNFSSFSKVPKSIPFCVSEMSQGTLQRKLMRGTNCCHQDKLQGYIRATDSGGAGQGADLLHFLVQVPYQAARQAHSEKEDGLMVSVLDWDLADGVNSPSPCSWSNQKKETVHINFRVLKHSQLSKYPQKISPLLIVLNSLCIAPLRLSTPDRNLLRNHTSSRKKRTNKLQNGYISAKAHLPICKASHTSWYSLLSCPFAVYLQSERANQELLNLFTSLFLIHRVLPLARHSGQHLLTDWGPGSYWTEKQMGQSVSASESKAVNWCTCSRGGQCSATLPKYGKHIN